MKSIRWLLLLLCAVVLMKGQTKLPPQQTTTTDDDDTEMTTCVDETLVAPGDGTTLDKTSHGTTSGLFEEKTTTTIKPPIPKMPIIVASCAIVLTLVSCSIAVIALIVWLIMRRRKKTSGVKHEIVTFSEPSTPMGSKRNEQLNINRSTALGILKEQ